MPLQLRPEAVCLSTHATLALQGDGGDQPLDLGGLAVLLAGLALE